MRLSKTAELFLRLRLKICNGLFNHLYPKNDHLSESCSGYLKKIYCTMFIV